MISNRHSLSMSSSLLPYPTTPFPNYLLDSVLPMLRDTEWRVLCVVVRQTLGWQESGQKGRRKERDWLTQSQLKARTGCASAALSQAIQTLVQKGFIVVENEDGNPLKTAAERRRCGGRLYYCLGERAFPSPTEGTTPSPKSGSSQSKQGYSESEVRKANTTKETLDKTTPYGGEQTCLFAVEKAVDNFFGRRASQEKVEADVKRFLQAYSRMFRARSPRKELPPIQWGKDGKMTKRLLHLYGYERLVELLERFFHSKADWIQEWGYSLSAFQTVLPRLLLHGDAPGEAKGQELPSRSQCTMKERRVPATPVVSGVSRGQGWSKAVDKPPKNALAARSDTALR